MFRKISLAFSVLAFCLTLGLVSPGHIQVSGVQIMADGVAWVKKDKEAKKPKKEKKAKKEKKSKEKNPRTKNPIMPVASQKISAASAAARAKAPKRANTRAGTRRNSGRSFDHEFSGK